MTRRHVETFRQKLAQQMFARQMLARQMLARQMLAAERGVLLPGARHRAPGNGST